MASDAAQGQSGGLLRSLLHQRLQRRQEPTEQGVAERLHGLLGERQGHGGTMGEDFWKNGHQFFLVGVEEKLGEWSGIYHEKWRRFTTKNGGGDEQNWDLSSVEVWNYIGSDFVAFPYVAKISKCWSKGLSPYLPSKRPSLHFFISVQTPLVIMATRATPLKFLFRCPSRVQSRCELQTHCITLSYASWSLWHSYHVNLHGLSNGYTSVWSLARGWCIMLSHQRADQAKRLRVIGMGIGVWWFDQPQDVVKLSQELLR